MGKVLSRKSKKPAKDRKPAKEPNAESISSELPMQQQVFALEYIKDWNGTRAAQRAGYAGDENVLAVQANRLLRNAKVVELIKKRVSEVAMSADEVLLRLAAQARGTVEPFIYQDDNPLKGEAPKIDLSSEAARQNIGLIKRIKTKTRTSIKEENAWEEVETEIGLYDAQAALDKLARHHGLYNDTVHHTGDVNVMVVKGVSVEEL